MTTLLHAPVHGADPFSKERISHSTYSVPYEPPPSYYQSSPTYPSEAYDSDGATHISSPTATRPKTPLPSYLQQSSYHYSATAPSEDSFDDDDEDDDMAFPSFAQEPTKVAAPAEEPRETEPSTEPSVPHTSDTPTEVSDDIAVRQEPTQHVDYLAHEWREEDIWASWSYVSRRRGRVNNHTRLENASWRQWTKTKNDLKTVSPESLNWLKDCDVTWLYGPLQIGPKSLTTVTPPPSRLSHSSSFIAKKSNLKKKSASAVMLEKSRSQHSLLQRAGEIIRVQQASSPAGGRPAFKRHASAFVLPSATDSSVSLSPPNEGVIFTGERTPYSNTETPTPNECKHVLFNDEVRQVRAIESDDDNKEEVEEIEYISDEDDDGGLMMAPVRSRSKTTTPRGSFSNDNKTIIPLPSTTLKYRTDTPEPVQPPQTGLWARGRKLSPSPSQETLRPSRPSQNYILEDDHELSDQPWQAPLDYESEYYEPGPGMRRTESGMFMPYDDMDEEEPPKNSLIGQALNAVNTFKDIAHVVWNVGWYKSSDNA
jgi:hypothetical protein